ncbi:MFS transporter [Kocuria sp.]|uniref:MFS transporter n=1 Tax=Kocuria sp. TaxID=1871328 RepID=UPI0025BCCC87|nr:MFS transporter [Kocuria sp.]
MNLTSTQKGIFATLFTVGLLANIEKGLAGAIGPFLTDPGYMDRLGLQAFNKTQFGLITTLFYFSFILMTFVAGWFVDRYGYRIFVPVALLILAVGSAFFGFAGCSSTSLIFILIPLARLVIGFGQAGYTNGTPPVVARTFDADRRGNVQAKVVSTAGIGTILVYGIFSPFVVARDFRWMYFLLAVLLVVATLMFVKLVPAAPELPGDGAASSAAAAGTEAAGTKEGTKAAAKKDVSILDAWKNRNSLVLGLCLLLNNLVGVGLLTWLATMYSQQFGITPTGWQYMVVMLGYGLSLWIAISTGPGVVKKWFENNEKVFMLIMSVIGAVLMIVAVIIPNLWGSAVMMWLANLFIMWAFSAILMLPYRLIPLKIIGSAFAVINIGAFVGGMAQGALIGAIVDAAGYTTAFVVLGVLLVLGGLAPFLLREPRTPLDPQGPRAAGPDADATTPPGEPHAGVDSAAGTTGRSGTRR